MIAGGLNGDGETGIAQVRPRQGELRGRPGGQADKDRPVQVARLDGPQPVLHGIEIRSHVVDPDQPSAPFTITTLWAPTTSVA